MVFTDTSRGFVDTSNSVVVGDISDDDGGEASDVSLGVVSLGSRLSVLLLPACDILELDVEDDLLRPRASGTVKLSPRPCLLLEDGNSNGGGGTLAASPYGTPNRISD